MLKPNAPVVLVVVVIAPPVPWTVVRVTVASMTGVVPAVGFIETLPCTKPAWTAKAETNRTTIAEAIATRFERMFENVFINKANVVWILWLEAIGCSKPLTPTKLRNPRAVSLKSDNLRLNHAACVSFKKVDES